MRLNALINSLLLLVDTYNLAVLLGSYQKNEFLHLV